MDLTLLAIIGVLVIVAVSGLSPKLGIAAPLSLVVAGVGLSYLPGVPAFELEPEVILAGVLPPLLYAAAVNMPVVDFRRDLKSIGGLSVVVVLASSVLCGLVFDRLIPGIGLAQGIALGAVLSPTDAVATSIVKRTGVAPRLVTLLDGESMLNDASALVLLRSAIAATGAGVSIWGVAGDFVKAVALAVLLGFVIGFASLVVRRRVHDATLNTAISFVVPFAAYTPAEHVGASGLVAVVVTGLVTGYWGQKYLRPQDRRAEDVNWRTIAFLLEGGVFLLVGLEAPGLVDDFRADGGEWTRLAIVTVAALVILLVVRAVFVVYVLLDLRHDRQQMTAGRSRLDPENVRLLLESPRARRMSERRRKAIHQMVARNQADIAFYEREKLTARDGGVLVWAGMRGSVTLAAAQTLPASTEQRPLLVLVALAVAVSTLVLQGGTLAWLVRRLGVESDRSQVRRDEIASLSHLLMDVAEARIDEEAPELDPVVVAQARAQSAPDKFTRWAGPDGEERERRLETYRELRQSVLSDQRDALMEARAEGRYDSAAIGEMLRRVDSGELSLAALE
ncbi:sodium:proton antiporter [Aeromicrobium sp. 9AM]|uniref:cation:proton antiporter n=1 Tax=Aeromicrobium sp. 9AM TaxID=2653126 RepID=UPI0012EF6F75|nr:cation:proton antiporter [Aeromicrobium sp. 9AM]VXC29783.1 conserved membrane hypothetical protein [Aeromicrobium sp. 9AM]